MIPPVLVKRQWDHSTKAEYTRKVFLERSPVGPPSLTKRQQFSHQELCSNEPRYDFNKGKSYLELYDSKMSPQMLILHELSLKKCLYLSKKGYLFIASDLWRLLDGHDLPGGL